MSKEAIIQRRRLFLKKLELLYTAIRVSKGGRIITVPTQNSWEVYDADTQCRVLVSPNIWRIMHVFEGNNNHIVMYIDDRDELYGYYVSSRKSVNLTKAGRQLGLEYVQLENGKAGILSASTADGSRVALSMNLSQLAPPATGIDVFQDGTIVCYNSPQPSSVYRNKTKIGTIPHGYIPEYKTLYKNYTVFLAKAIDGEILYNKDFKTLYINNSANNSEIIVHNQLAILIDETLQTRSIYSQKHRKFIPDTEWFDGFISQQYLKTFQTLTFKDRLVWSIPEDRSHTLKYIGDLNQLINFNMVDMQHINHIKAEMGLL